MRPKKRAVATYKQMTEVINKAWIDTAGILVLLPIGINAANNVRRGIEKEMDAAGEFYFKTRPKLIPTQKVIKKYHIDANLIRREAKLEENK